MRYGKVITITALGAFVATAPFAAQAQTTKDKIENSMEETKEKAKSTTQEAKTAVSDSWVTSKTKIALFSDERVKGTQVSVDTANGVVHLRGKVDSDEAKQAAAEVAKSIEGVKSVKNDLQVVAPTARKAVDANDKDIAKTAESRIHRDASLKKVDVRADDGVVTLTGEVPSITAAAKASEMARGIPGVKAVKNELTVRQANK
ncbi:MAG TPA: BON domain-containing protein [Candidatus Nitrosotalea sp.]|jgi:hyperosmotically inducible protein|nr:BON domain-containing protein [Candidatus Nitrosotalea sp.]